MTNSPHRQIFLNWLVANDFSYEARPDRIAIAIASTKSHEKQALGRDLAGYLNEFDEAGGGAWASFNDEMTSVLEKMQHPVFKHECKCNLGSCPCNDSAEIKLIRQHKRMVKRFAEIGNAVLVQEHAHNYTRELPSVFQVLLHSDGQQEDLSKFHLTLNTGRLSLQCATRIIADSALDWAQSSIAA